MRRDAQGRFATSASDDVLDSLLRLGTATVSDLAEDTGRRKPRVWDALQTLARQGRARRLTGGKRFYGRHGTAPQRWVALPGEVEP